MEEGIPLVNRGSGTILIGCTLMIQRMEMDNRIRDH
jgi:hypothetical protein